MSNGSGGALSETPEASLTASRVNAITALKEQIAGLLPPHALSSGERDQIFGNVKTILGFSAAIREHQVERSLPD